MASCIYGWILRNERPCIGIRAGTSITGASVSRGGPSFPVGCIAVCAAGLPRCGGRPFYPHLIFSEPSTQYYHGRRDKEPTYELRENGEIHFNKDGTRRCSPSTTASRAA